MRFNIACLAIVVLVAGGSFAAKPQVVFGESREAILAGDCYKSGGFYFGVGKGVVRSDGSASDNFAKVKAVQDAKVDLVCRKAVDDVVWPRALDSNSIAVLSRLVYRHITVQASVCEMEVVFLEKSDNLTYTAVVAASEESLKSVSHVSFDVIKSVLLSPHRLKAYFKKHPRELYVLYLTQKQLPEALVGVDFTVWNDEQLDLFCGVPRCNANANAVGNANVVGEEEMTAGVLDNAGNMERGEQNGAGKGKSAVGNINETIEF